MRNKHGGTESQHVKALKAMGAKLPLTEEPEIPKSVAYLWELHKSVRFSLIPDNEKLSLMPRDPITIRDLIAYIDQSGLRLNREEIDAILAIDAIFEKYRG